MRDDHSQAHNLFSRLISYSPRIGEANRTRTALEDYFTEALAWCLRSPDFRKTFFALIKEESSFPCQEMATGGEAGIEVHTQLSFSPADDAETEDEEVGSRGRRRFDLVIQSSAEPRFVIVIEDKVSWRFTPNQLSAYQKELEIGERFKNFAFKLLIVLSPSGEKPDCVGTLPVIPLRWSGVQRKLADFSGHIHGRRHDQMNLSAIQFVCAQLADFLKEKGLASMKIDRTDNNQLNGWIAGFEAQESMTRILASVRENRRQLKKTPVFDPSSGDDDDDGSRWFGLYNRGSEAYFYVGFRLRDKHGKSELRMWIQMSCPKEKDLKDRLIIKLRAKDVDTEEEGNGTILNLSKRITGTGYDGDADNIRGWFENTLASIDEVVKSTQQLGIDRVTEPLNPPR